MWGLDAYRRRKRLILMAIARPLRDAYSQTVTMREVVNGLMYVLSSGCKWRFDRCLRQQGRPLVPAHRLIRKIARAPGLCCAG